MSETAVTPRRRVAHPPSGRPVLLYDGNCNFCRLWVERWRAAAGDRFTIEPSQTSGGRFPEIPVEEYDRAVQLIEPDGNVYAAAEAVLRARALGTGRSRLLSAYENNPAFAAGVERIYGWVASHRVFLSRLTRLFWGADARRPTFGTSHRLFLRLLGLVHLIAFVSFWVQLNGLAGPRGILPAQPFLEAVRAQIGPSCYWRLPTLSWIFGGYGFLHVLCGAGVALSLALMAGLAPAVCLALLWIGYLSLCAAGQAFMNFQWDALLLETTFLAIFSAPWSWRTGRSRADPPRLARWLLWWLLIRLMLLSGAVKLLSGDAAWWHLTALTYHFETQPLPTWIAWYAAKLPAGCLQASCAAMFVIELGAPFLLFLPRRARHFGAGLQILLQVLITLTGNYTFFNLLTVTLCLLFFDDRFWSPLRTRVATFFRRSPFPAPVPRPCPRRLLVPAAGAIFFLTGIVTLATIFPAVRPLQALDALPEALGSFRTFNRYGLFAVMTRQRPEIIIEGSDDGRTWQPYAFRAKPGDLRRRPGFVAPYQPRLDWQLWFAALDYPQREPWVANLCVRLLQGSPAVLNLFAANPFPRHPPRQIRAVLYDYRFTTRAQRAATGRWWERTPVDFYLPPFSLR